MDLDTKFMKQSILEAKKAQEIDEVPVGAVIVKDNKIIARGFNKREKSQDPIMHAEIIAIRKACKKFNSWRLEDCTLYVTIEPCTMCAGTMVWSRIKRVVFGASDLKGGAFGGSVNINDFPNLNHRIEVTSNVLANECSSLIKNFFQNKRKNS